MKRRKRNWVKALKLGRSLNGHYVQNARMNPDKSISVTVIIPRWVANKCNIECTPVF